MWRFAQKMIKSVGKSSGKDVSSRMGSSQRSYSFISIQNWLHRSNSRLKEALNQIITSLLCGRAGNFQAILSHIRNFCKSSKFWWHNFGFQKARNISEKLLSIHHLPIFGISADFLKQCNEFSPTTSQI